jgi:Hint domain
VGDEVITHNGRSEPIKWIGRRAFSTRFLNPSSPVTPVVIRADAIADGVPHRDLRVSPEHGIYFDGVLVPAGQLVNGSTIVRELAGDVVEYFHIEVEGQVIVLADGVPAETYVNHNNRKMFANWREYRLLYGSDDLAETESCEYGRVYPCLTSGPRFETSRAMVPSRRGKDFAPRSRKRWPPNKNRRPSPGGGSVKLLAHTAILAALTGRALTIFRAGFALKIIFSPLKGLMPSRSLVAGFLTTTNFAKPGTTNTPFFLSSLWPTSVRASIMPFTSFFASSRSWAIFSISCDFVIWVCILSPMGKWQTNLFPDSPPEKALVRFTQVRKQN